MRTRIDPCRQRCVVFVNNWCTATITGPVTLSAIDGRVLVKTNALSGRATLGLEQLPPGSYVVELQGDGNREAARIVVRQ
ncbi:MAG: T9SS type A sorting domain-containing protein [Chitinivibrionales bacterium]|nr:T9SS type A sorting domain-containing protein [Chitinivibrionales bacterium]